MFPDMQLDNRTRLSGLTGLTLRRAMQGHKDTLAAVLPRLTALQSLVIDDDGVSGLLAAGGHVYSSDMAMYSCPNSDADLFRDVIVYTCPGIPWRCRRAAVRQLVATDGPGPGWGPGCCLSGAAAAQPAILGATPSMPGALGKCSAVVASRT
jgi:hypothetical protein